MPSTTMEEIGQRMYQHGVRDVIFVHGTAVGNDPLDIFNDVESFKLIHSTNSIINTFVNNPLTKRFEKELKRELKEFIDTHLDDVGNYTQEYVKDFGEQIGNVIRLDSVPFTWGGGNSHRARLQAAFDLAARLASRINDTEKLIEENERILLIGHSHAGQLFALMTIFLQGEELAEKLFRVSDEHRVDDVSQLQDNLKIIKTVYLDFATFGTPVRYKWARYNRFRLLPVINHRSNSKLDIKAIFNVEDGDYVQQWGTEGTNMPSPHPAEDELSTILENQGFGLLKALQNAAKSYGYSPIGRPEHQYIGGNGIVAKNLLIDYGDQRPTGDDDFFYCVKKVFGHGIYTTKEKMQFNTKLIANHFYPETDCSSF